MKFNSTIMNGGVMVLMTRNHPSEYFHQKTNFSDHFLEDHAGSFIESQLPFLIARGKRSSLVPFKTCPFCNCTLTDFENEFENAEQRADRLKISKKLQKHIGNHLLNFSLLAFLEPDEMDDNLGSDVMNVQDSRSSMISSAQRSEHGSSETDDVELRTQERFQQVRVTMDVPELDSDVNWESIIRNERSMPELPENDPKLETFVERLRAIKGQGQSAITSLMSTDTHSPQRNLRDSEGLLNDTQNIPEELYDSLSEADSQPSLLSQPLPLQQPNATSSHSATLSTPSLVPTSSTTSWAPPAPLGNTATVHVQTISNLVIGIDFGTTFSGVAYCPTLNDTPSGGNHDAAKVAENIIDKTWPNPNQQYLEKTPSIISYKSEPPTWARASSRLTIQMWSILNSD